MRIREQDLPGIGKRISFTNRDGISTVIIHHFSGKREVYFLTEEDDEDVLFSTTFTSDEAKEFGARLLGIGNETVDEESFERFRIMRQKMLVDWIKVKKASTLANQTVKEAQLRVPENVSIVGVVREKDILPKPEDDFVIQAGDTLLVIGKKEAVSRFEAACKGKG
ncbi:TrkA domain protein [Planomicrobium soli]|uniref:TrkA domain protein n=1 Tax=Planomicrobium soli TaxID=1176648 RepID=A0A2P8H421_9BACL|nr:TrkA C-terminal domain-containing protein [Planomicrobium soli]PSL40953.1 TrkA domain protein [Planomicrobium soli]